MDVDLGEGEGGGGGEGTNRLPLFPDVDEGVNIMTCSNELIEPMLLLQK